MEDRKTQTRRIAKGITDETCYVGLEGHNGFVPVRGDAKETPILCPFGKPGDRLWVRETIRFNPQHANYYYEADNHGCGEEIYKKLGNRPEKRLRIPSMFMPRIASRITLEVTGVRVERLQDISHRDALAEGVEYDVSKPFGSPLERFRKLWVSINGIDSWNANPWLWRIAFRRL